MQTKNQDKLIAAFYVEKKIEKRSKTDERERIRRMRRTTRTRSRRRLKGRRRRRRRGMSSKFQKHSSTE